MMPYDKFGNRIYFVSWRKMCNHAKLLRKHGYVEAKTKPNLFYRKDDDSQAVFFADMRGTYGVKVWEDDSPLMYVQFPDMPDWRKRRLFNIELNKLPMCRLGYPEAEPDGLFSSDTDGYCKFCGKDFQADGEYCSVDCEENAREEIENSLRIPKICPVCGKEIRNLANGGQHYCSVECMEKGIRKELVSNGLKTCEVCGRKILDSCYRDAYYNTIINEFPDLEFTTTPIEHHVSYREDRTITVCASCHAKIHRSTSKIFDKFKPIDKPSDKPAFCNIERDFNLILAEKNRQHPSTSLKKRSNTARVESFYAGKKSIYKSSDGEPITSGFENMLMKKDLMERIEILEGTSDKHIV